MNCIYCGEQLNEENNSKEHVIQNALGGLLESTNICCDKCNNLVEKHIDNEFCKIFSPILTSLPSIKKTNKSALPTCIGQAKYKVDGEIYRVTIKGGKIVDCIDAKREHRKNFTKNEYKDDFEILTYNFDLENESFRNGLTKIAVNYALHNNIPIEQIKKLIKVQQQDKEVKNISFNAPIVPFIPLNSLDAFLELGTTIELYHNLILFSYKNFLVCFIDLFNTFQHYVILSNEWSGKSIHHSYLQLIEKIDRSVPMHKPTDIKDIHILANMYNIEPNYDIENFLKDIKIAIQKKSYEKDMINYLSNRISRRDCSKIIDTQNFKEIVMSTRFYLDEDDVLIKEHYKIFSPLLCESTKSILFYPVCLSKLFDRGYDFKQYTFKKFKRLTSHLNENLSKTANNHNDG
ncbi:HNH endonuclease [Lysinibacillus agricola]|uniref:HNH endonuclease n=1 Tax=Lysinibacillus agricola TaxID=2590012 RepID=UPI003C1B697F